MKFVMGDLIIMAIMALNSPLKLNITSHVSTSKEFISAVKVNGSLSLAAPKTILSFGFCSCRCSTICGIPFSAKRNLSSYRGKK